ncbi:hypothetical protein K466DRAFT_589661 [Polyporus arcularius HHB13444]|uniref:Uncharacterized protein n=1 Tax=Polyporus arcularius HHB13444 TaxID=1314778 RepID=A0A5C3P5G2_9APHY|nr:hypothetical protein K466DRAFT_589661 [Polyporus arcularius HHB13444]
MERHAPIPTPASARPPRPVRRQSQRSQADPNADGPVPLCLADEYMMRIAPGWQPADEPRLHRLLAFMGADTPDKRDAVLTGFNASAAEVIQRGGVHVIGVKPKPGDQNVYNIRIPDSALAIRMWEGGMAPYGQFCLDFYDVDRKVSVNLPSGHSLHPATVPVPVPGGFQGQGFVPPGPVRYTSMNGGPLGPGYPPPGFPTAPTLNPPSFQAQAAAPLRSWERNMGLRAIPDGEEKWMLPQGAYITLKRVGHPDVVFQIPTLQPAFVTLQPQMGTL